MLFFIYRLNPVIEAHSTNWSRRSKPTTMNVLKKSRSIGVVPLLETSPLQGSTSKTKLNLQNLLLKPKQNCFSNGNKGISKKLFFLLLFNHGFFRYSPTPEIMFSASTAPLFYISCNFIDVQKNFSLEF